MTFINAKKVLLKDELGNALIPYVENIQTLPVGQIMAVNCGPNYVPEGTLPCDGNEYSKEQFKDLWDNYLTGELVDKYELGWQQPFYVGDYDWNSVVYGDDLFVAVGHDAIATSKYGTDWKIVDTSSYLWRDVTYGNGKFVAVGGIGTVATSTDGENWTIRTICDNTLYSVTYALDNFIAVGGNGCIIKSLDGIDWYDYTQKGPADKDLKYFGWQSITYQDDEFVVAGVHNASYGYIMTSVNGVTWSTPSALSDSSFTPYHVFYGQNKYIVAGYYDGIAISTNGTKFNCVLKDEHSWHCVTYAKDKFVAIATDGYMADSLDGITWSVPYQVGTTDLNYIVYTEDTLLVVGDGGQIVHNPVITKYNTLLSTCPYIEYQAEIIKYGQCNKFAVEQVTECVASCSDDNFTVTDNQTVIENQTYTYIYKKNEEGVLKAHWYNEIGQQVSFNDIGITLESDANSVYEGYTFTVTKKIVSDGVFRVPLIKNGTVIQQALTNEELGKCYNAGLPNITAGPFIWRTNTDRDSQIYGAMALDRSVSNYADSADSNDNGPNYTFDASLANTIYGNSDTVQPNAVALRYFVVVSNAKINQSKMDWSQWASGLQNKLNSDLSNCAKPYITQMSDSTMLPSWYKVYSNGWCEQGGLCSYSANTATVALLKHYKTPFYCISLTDYDKSDTGGLAASSGVASRATDTFTITTTSETDGGIYWETKGYIS